MCFGVLSSEYLIANQIKYLDLLTSSRNPLLNTPAFGIIESNVLIIDSLLLYKTITFFRSPTPGSHLVNLTIAGSKGRKIITLDDLDLDGRHKEKIIDVLTGYRTELLSKGSWSLQSLEGHDGQQKSIKQVRA